MTERAETARKIAIEAGALTPCPSCGVVHRTGVDPAEGYKVANLGFSQGLYRDVFPDRRAMTDAVKDAIESALTTCACSAPAPVKPPSPVATKPAAPTTAAHPTPRPSEQQHPPGRTLRDIALGSVSQELREPLLTWAGENQITTPNDPFWPLATALVNGLAASQAAGDAARQVGMAIGTIQTEIYQGAAKASADVKAAIETSIVGTINTTIDIATRAGADALRKAAADLPAVARQEQSRIVQEWRSALAEAALKNAFAGFLQRLSVNVTVLVILVVGIFISGAIAGAMGIETIMRSQHRLTPPQWRLLVDQKGVPECGALGTRTVCLARKTLHPH